MMAFWAAFLLVHLGGPDAITALSMEDNALWTRHPIALIAQLSVFVYIFVKTLPDNRLLVPTILICVTGVINYGERTRALYLASSGNLRKIIEKDPVLEESEVSLIFHRILTGLIVNMVPDLHDCQMSQKHILSYHPLHIRHSISWELKHLFELFYTKMKAANTRWGMIARAVTLYSTLAAFILFCNGHKHQFQGGDLVITYALFAGAFVIHLANMIIALSSVVKNSSSPKETILMFLGQGIFPPLVIYALVGIIATCAGGTALGDLFIRRDPPKKMASFNILSHCFKQITLKKGRKPGFIWNKLTRARHVSREHVDPSLQRSVWMYIRENAAGATDEAIMREFYEARGDQALRSIDQLRPYIEGLPYEKTLLIWHIATEICVNMEAGEDYIDNDDRKKMRMYSKKLSDYMMYHLVWQPKLMYALAGISHIRCNETYAELKLLGEKLEVPTMQQFCELILRECVDIVDQDVEENNDTFSVLKVSCMLVGLIRENNDRWEVIYKVWLEMLSYAAGHCSGESHARQLSEGGEFVTTIWILMSLCGIGVQFPINYDTRFSYRPV